MDDLKPLKPSVYTPFLRRFTDERARDLEDLRALYSRVHDAHQKSRYVEDDAENELGGWILGSVRRQLPDINQAAVDIVCCAIHGVLRMETPIWEMPEPRFDFLDLKDAAELRRKLYAKEFFYEHERRVIETLVDGLSKILAYLAGMLPQTEDPSPFTIPLIFALPDPRKTMDNVIGELYKQPYIDTAVFVELSRAVHFNLCAVSGIADPHEINKPYKLPSQSNAPLHEIVEAYFKGTPFYEFLLSPVPLKFSNHERFSHMHVIGGSGAGKTTLLQNLILNDLEADDPPSLVVVDSQGDLIRKLSHLALMQDRDVVLISPKDIQYPPAINIFDIKRLGHYSDVQKEQLTAGIIQTFDYLFSGLIGADLTAKQGVFFRFVARLMLALPQTFGRNATILDMLNLMDDPTPYVPAIKTLPDIQRNFFERDFLNPKNKTFQQTREQIRYRLNAILENPTLERLFTSTETKIDLFSILNQGGIVLIDTAKDFLKGSSSHFGRIFISLVLQAVLERAVIPETQRKPTFLIVDEAAQYFDSNIDDFLTEARKYNCGCVFAHQFLDQATSSLKASLAANTAIKFAAAVSTNDARQIAPDMRTTADFILSQPKLTFAAHIRNVTPSAVSIPVEVGRLERRRQLSSTEYGEFIKRNRLRVCGQPDPVVTPPPPKSGPSQRGNESPQKTSTLPSDEPPQSVDDPRRAAEDW